MHGNTLHCRLLWNSHHAMHCDSIWLASTPCTALPHLRTPVCLYSLNCTGGYNSTPCIAGDSLFTLHCTKYITASTPWTASNSNLYCLPLHPALHQVTASTPCTALCASTPCTAPSYICLTWVGIYSEVIDRPPRSTEYRLLAQHDTDQWALWHAWCHLKQMGRLSKELLKKSALMAAAAWGGTLRCTLWLEFTAL